MENELLINRIKVVLAKKNLGNKGWQSNLEKTKRLFQNGVLTSYNLN